MKSIASVISKKLFAWPLLAFPATYMLFLFLDGSLSAWKYSEMQDFFGNTAIGCLIIVLCLTPLKQFFPKWPVIAALNVHRRATGISCFLYASFHAFLYVNQTDGPSEIVRDFQQPDLFYLYFGLMGLCLLLPLFLTSNNFSVKHLKYKWWKRLHRIAYLAAIILFLHRGFGENDDLFGTLLIFLPLIVLESLRIGRNFLQLLFKDAPAKQPPPVLVWDDEKLFCVDKIVVESDQVHSFYLKPTEKFKLPNYKPGQFLTFRFDIPEQEKPVVRCYSLSDAPGNDYFRISVKRIPAPRNKPELPPGLSSSFLHDHVKEGDTIKVLAPNGNFCLPEGNKLSKIVMIGSGIGITPVLSMLNHLHKIGIKRGSDIWFFYGVRNGSEQIMKQHLKTIASANKHLKLHVCYSTPDEQDTLGEDYHIKGRVSLDLLKKTLPGNDFDFYFCGPGPMMADLAEGLDLWGVADERIHFEAFGPSTVKRKSAPVKSDNQYQVKFDQTGKTLNWTGESECLLEFAEANGVTLPFGCRMGNCGSCSQKLVKGEVHYPVEPSFTPEEGHCLTCSSVPVSDIELA
ncbi:ferric reductase-like transmembrane domain-containing protein [Methyloprofundus sp.]|uniref:ferric reductase-like transmembrane domain-containing protein n=1 Tax=Methyloprofundus sp. TaxID=2020875 RepID=UPI003D0D7A7D